MKPHRAFSLFLFNKKNELLITQRSLEKITFGGMWTNTCCSHPRHSEEEIQTNENYIGPRKASVRRTAFELGIKDLTLDKVHCGARILYYADADQNFAEYELDYIMFTKYDPKPFKVNPEEVKSYRFVAIDEFDKFLDDRFKMHGETITPWFKLLKERSLMVWWE